MNVPVEQRPSSDSDFALASRGRPTLLAAASPLDVVVVDDDEGTRELIVALLERIGHRCRTASDGNDALRVIAERPADVIISDWNMPGMNGAELCRRTRSLGDDAPYTYFILMTGCDDHAHLLEGMHAGADDYQCKPVNLSELAARLVSAGRVVNLHRRLAARNALLRHDGERFYLASRTDALTGLANRLCLDEELHNLLVHAQRYGHRASLAMCDIDFFKSYNDRFGHVAGDEALRLVAGAMRGSLRSVDTVYRYGGEEFVVLLVEQSSDAAERAMNRVRQAVADLALPSPSTGGALTLSVGIAQLDVAADPTSSHWLGRADELLYEAKSAGRNRVLSTSPPRLA